jgi:hypothetical protein
VPSSRVHAIAVVVLVTICDLGLTACSSGGYQSDYVSPIAATPAPPPEVPVAGAPAGATRRMPLLPPVPEHDTGLPPAVVR